jgi:hypothetical protein
VQVECLDAIPAEVRRFPGISYCEFWYSASVSALLADGMHARRAQRVDSDCVIAYGTLLLLDVSLSLRNNL